MPALDRPISAFPALASTMVPPRLNLSSCSAAAIIDNAMQSLIEQPGFWLSSLMNSPHGSVSNYVSLKTGFSPINSTPDLKDAFRWLMAASLSVGRFIRISHMSGGRTLAPPG